MFRNTAFIFSALALAACATSSQTDGKMVDKNPNATTVEVLAPEPVIETAKAPANAPDAMTDVTGKKLEAADMTAQDTAPELENLYYVAQTKWEMMRFIEAVNAAELATALEADGAMTIFAPTSDAFAQAGETAATADLLKGHIVSGKMMAKDLMARAAKGETKLTTLAGSQLTVYVMGETVKIADPSGRLYTVVTADNEASNGVLHQINGVLSATALKP